MRQIRLVIADVDGTLLAPEATLSQRTRDAVARLRQDGIALVLTTGGPPRAVARLAQALELTTPIAAFDGGLFAAADLSDIIEQRPLPLAVAREAVEYLQSSGLDVWVYRGFDWFVDHAGMPFVQQEQRIVQFAPTVVPDVRTVLDRAVKIVGVNDDAALVSYVEFELRRRIGDFARVARSPSARLEITDPDANRAMVVRDAARILGVAVEEVAAVGALPDDVLMFGVAGTSIALGKALPEVRRAARHVASPGDDGFADALERIVLGRARPGFAAFSGLPHHTRACLFDLDGVLTQTAKLHAAAWKEMFDAFLREWSRRTGEPFVPFDMADYARYVDGKLREDGARSFLASRGFDAAEELVRELSRRKDALFRELLRTRHVDTYDGSIRFVREARNAGLRTAVVSASKNCRDVLASAGISDLFDARIDGYVAAEAHLAGKPAPDTFLAAAQALGVDPSESAVFEDALAGVDAGRAGRFGFVVGVDRVGQSAELRKHGADRVVTDLASLLEPP